MKVHKRELFSSLIGSVIIVSVFTACGPQGKKPEVPKHAHAEKEIYEGELDKKLSEIYSKENEALFDACDVKNRSKILEIAKELEKRREGIAKLIKQASEEAGADNFTEIGPYKFKNRPVDAVSENKWVTDTFGWGEVIENYEQIRKLPLGPEWIALNNNARILTPSDENRIAHSVFLGMGRTSLPKMIEIKRVVDRCAMDNPCTNPALSPEQRKYLSSSGGLKLAFPVFESKTRSLHEKRTMVLKFKKAIDGYGNSASLVIYEKVRVEGKSLVIPVDISTFAGGESQAIDLIEKTWNIDPEFKIKIEPVKASEKTYSVSVSHEPNGRAYVERESFKLQLYNFGRLTTISHEFGHILGFPDFYYTVWNPSSCSYETEANGGDLMSYSGTGNVLPEHWELLKKAYWK